MSDYAQQYDDTSFWNKIRHFAVKAGKPVIEHALVLYFCLKDPETPARAKAIVIGALGYFILPLDAIPDLIPAAGFADDLAVLLIATASVLAHVKPEHRRRAGELMDWERSRGKRESGGGSSRQEQGPRTFASETEKESHYKRTLDLAGEITPSALKERYRELAHKYHPDKVRHLGVEFQEMAGQKLKEINTAYEFLKRKYGEA